MRSVTVANDQEIKNFKFNLQILLFMIFVISDEKHVYPHVTFVDFSVR